MIFPYSSISACLRLDIYAKKQLWQINYDCVSVSMELPMMSTNNTMRMTDTAIEETSVAGNTQSSVTEPMTEMVTSEAAVVRRSEMNSAEISERPEVEDITEIFEIIPENATPIK